VAVSTPGPFLAEVRGGKVDHDASQRPLEAGVLDRRTDPVACVVHRRTRQAGEDEARQAAPDEGLHRNRVPADAENRDARDPRVHVGRP
jgi:hypothetical protein